MKFRSYFSFNGNCEEAINLYKEAFKTEIENIMRFKDIPANPNFSIPSEYEDKIMQCTLKIGSDFIRLSDVGPDIPFNFGPSQNLSIVIEASVEEIQFAFDKLSKEGKVIKFLETTFYSPLAGSLVDKFGIYWQFAAQK